MVLRGRLPLALAIAAPVAAVGMAERCWESGGERMDCCWIWFAGVCVRLAASRSESEGEETIWLSPSWSADILGGAWWLEPGCVG